MNSFKNNISETIVLWGVPFVISFFIFYVGPEEFYTRLYVGRWFKAFLTRLNPYIYIPL